MQHPAHFRASFVDAMAFHLFNDSGLAPPMDFVFTSGVATCAHFPCSVPNESFGEASQELFRVGMAPGAQVLTEGACPHAGTM